MSKLKYIPLIIVLLFNINVISCVNEYQTLLSGEVTIDGIPTNGKVWNNEIDTVKLRIKANYLFNSYQYSNSVQELSDYAAALIYLGEYQKAKAIYHQIEKESPNLYTTASNIGTIYELIGKPDSALIWIKKSIELNPESHKGSEWIHIKILEFKISQSTDYSKSILGLDFGNEAIPANPNNYDLETLEKHIRHQLKERTTFVKPTNQIVGNIYFDLGNIIAQKNTVQSALESYDAAEEYGYKSDLFNVRVDQLEKLANKIIPYQLYEDLKDLVQKDFMVALFILVTGLVLFILLIIRVIKGIKKKLS